MITDVIIFFWWLTGLASWYLVVRKVYNQTPRKWIEDGMPLSLAILFLHPLLGPFGFFLAAVMIAFKKHEENKTNTR